jgi:ribosome-associated protein YbcJ (S4-like RNA binding protein)
MSENDVAINTLNSTLQRHAKVVHGYEVEIANMTAEIYRLKQEIEALKEESESD